MSYYSLQALMYVSFHILPHLLCLLHKVVYLPKHFNPNVTHEVCFSRYLHGNNVNGHAFVVFGVMEVERKTSIPSSLQRVQVSFPDENTPDVLKWCSQSDGIYIKHRYQMEKVLPSWQRRRYFRPSQTSANWLDDQSTFQPVF